MFVLWVLDLINHSSECISQITILGPNCSHEAIAIIIVGLLVLDAVGWGLRLILIRFSQGSRWVWLMVSSIQPIFILRLPAECLVWGTQFRGWFNNSVTIRLLLDKVWSAHRCALVTLRYYTRNHSLLSFLHTRDYMKSWNQELKIVESCLLCAYTIARNNEVGYQWKLGVLWYSWCIWSTWWMQS